MFIKSIYLENIRSYVDQKINFQKGITLISGDIGSGKSTVLLAIEFALFGIKRGSVSGGALLRKGDKEGKVILELNLNNIDVKIERTLKRTTSSIGQDSGVIWVGNERYEGTAIELKQRILGLLNYPLELLTKNKEDLFRYTVYTPQEQMKQILFSKKDERLDTLRRMFDIDKYKTISNNCETFLSRLRYKSKDINEDIKDLEKKEKEKKEVGEKKKKVEVKKEKLIPEVKKAEKSLLKKKEELALLEEERVKLNELKKQKEVNEVNLKHFIEKTRDWGKKQEQLKDAIKDLEKEVKDKKVVDNQKEIKQLKKETLEIEEEMIILRNNIQDCKSKIVHSEEIMDGVSKLKFCPTCRQEVKKEHKHDIEKKESGLIKDLEKKLIILSNEENKKKKLLSETTEAIEKLSEEERYKEILLMKNEQLKERKDGLLQAEKEIVSIKKSIGKLNVENSRLLKEIELMKDLEKKIEKKKLEEGEFLKEFHSLEINNAELTKDIEKHEELINLLEKEIKEMIEKRNQLKKINDIYSWLEQYFLNLMVQIEKNVMAKIHIEFNSLFQKWAGMLIDMELISSRLDYDFSPLIEQNGYDIEYEDLSGGEKTAMALAYRLALNQLVTEIHGKIKSKDLLILDEPTDGFSSEQLDRLKEVLANIKVRQIIIVSHESKIESFVDHVMRISKKGHVSTITA